VGLGAEVMTTRTCRIARIGAAVAFGCAFGCAFGFTEARASTVQMYGRVDLNLTRAEGQPWEMSQASNSRWGLRGSEVLGGGVQAQFQIESRFDADSGRVDGTRFWSRESWVGLRSRLGALRLGRSQTPSQRIASQFDPHGTDGIGSLGSSGLLLGHGSLPRFDNAVHIELARWRGVSAMAAHQFDELRDQRDERRRSLRLRWEHGRLDLALGHARLGPGQDAASLAAAWREPGHALMAQWHRGRRGGQTRQTWLVGATAQRFGLDWRGSISRSEAVANDPTRRTLVALGADQPWSRRTALYGTWAHERGPGRTFGHGFELGLRHAF
jgi:predicted porin